MGKEDIKLGVRKKTLRGMLPYYYFFVTLPANGATVHVEVDGISLLSEVCILPGACTKLHAIFSLLGLYNINFCYYYHIVCTYNIVSGCAKLEW